MRNGRLLSYGVAPLTWIGCSLLGAALTSTNPAASAEPTSRSRTVVRAAAVSFVPVKFDLAGNADRLERAFRRAAEGGAQIAVAPEGVLEGYVVNEIIAGDVPAEKIREVAVPIEHSLIKRFRDLARDLEMCLVFGFAERIGDDVYNAAVFIDHSGHICGKYHKMQLAEGYHPKWWFNRLGQASRAFDTPIGRCGILICNDRWNPSLARIPALDGAQFLVIPSFGSRSQAQDEAVLGRGRENGLPVIEANVGVTLIVDDGQIVAVDRQEEGITFGQITIGPPVEVQPGDRDRVEKEFLTWRETEMKIRYERRMDSLKERPDPRRKSSEEADPMPAADEPPTGDALQSNATPAGGDHWAFLPVTRPRVPGAATADPRNSIDCFVHKRLKRRGETLSSAADRRTLIRRVTLDLIGLPPTAEEVRSFVDDARPDAYERVVDRLLASPHYGERWARNWLDLCHYADSDGYLTDQLRPVAWRYRAWLVDALNAGLPFDTFTIQQLAGDLLPGASTEERLATGFLRQTLSNREGGADPEEFRVEQVVDRTQIVGATWLALSVGCARCHDHKHDPLSQREFYELFACFDNAEEINIDAPLADEVASYEAALPAYRRRRTEAIEPVREAVAGLQQKWEEKLREAWQHPGRDPTWDRQWELLGLVWGGGLGEGQLEGWQIVMLPSESRTDLQRDRLLDYFLKSGELIDPPQFKALQLGELSAALQRLKSELPPVTRAPTMHAAPNFRETYVHRRGDFRDPGDRVEPGFPAVLPGPAQAIDRPARLAFAEWLVSPSHPLTARVTVNRMWHDFFGRGLVETLGDFGVAGSRPSHPLLLDWMADEFVASGWSVKRMQRQIVTSKVYRQPSTLRLGRGADRTTNRYFARQAAIRMSAEQIRDAALHVSGLLDPRIGGPSVRPPQPASVSQEGFDNAWEVSRGGDQYRRGLYTFVQRTSPFAQHVLFDGPSPNRSCTRRERSNTPLQSLALLNDPVFFDAARALARVVLEQPVGGTADRVNYLYERCLSRLPSGREAETMVDYLATQRAILISERGVSQSADAEAVNRDGLEVELWTLASSVLLNLHEFITRH